MIRVLFIMSDLSGGGAERSLLDLLARLDRTRIQPSLFLLRRAGVHLARAPKDVELSWGCETHGRLRYHLPSLLLKVTARAAQADVIVGAMESTSSYVAWFVATLLGKPLVAWVKTDLDAYLGLLPHWHRWVAQQMYPRCDAIVIPSQGSLASITRIAGLCSEKLHILHNPVDLVEVRAMARTPLPASLPRIFIKPTILGVGRLEIALKGFDLLIRAHAEVRSRSIDHNLVILGEGPDRAHLLALAQSLHVENSVFLPGFQINPFPFFKAAVALAAPARLDGFGRVFLEAMALGLPVIGSDASGPAEILDHGKYGIMMPPEDVSALAHAMYSLLTDPQLREHYAKLSLERAHDYCPDRLIPLWSNLLCGLGEPEWKAARSRASSIAH